MHDKRDSFLWEFSDCKTVKNDENKKPSFIFVRSSSLDEEILFCQIHRPISFWHTQLFGQFFPSSKEKSLPSKRNFAKWSLSSQKNL